MYKNKDQLRTRKKIKIKNKVVPLCWREEKQATDDWKLVSNQSASVWGVVDRPEEIEMSFQKKLSLFPKNFLLW